jgi:ABC-type lipoprotein export system ATPase subunit
VARWGGHVALWRGRAGDRRLGKLGFVFQFHFLLAEFSVLDNVTLPMRRLGRLDEAAAQARGMEVLARWALATRRRSARTSSRAGSGNAWPSRGRSPTIRS